MHSLIFLFILFNLFKITICTMDDAEENKILNKILVLYSPDAKTHFLSMLPLLKWLAHNGNHIHILQIISSSNENGGTTQQNWIFSDSIFPNSITFTKIALPAATNSADVQQRAMLGEAIWNRTMHSPALASSYEQKGQKFDTLIEHHHGELVALLNAKWDLVIVSELFSLHGYFMAQMLYKHAKIPYVIFSTSMMLSSTAYGKALGRSWVTNPHRFAPTPQHPKHDCFDVTKFKHRLMNVCETLVEFGAVYFIENHIIAKREYKFSPQKSIGGFNLPNFHHQSGLTIMDSIDMLAFPQPTFKSLPNAGSHCERRQPSLSESPAEIFEFMNDRASKGTIFMAFGTFISWEFAPRNIFTSFMTAFGMFPEYHVIFAARGIHHLQTKEEMIPKNVHIVAWAPQQAILAHPKTRLFITHCGLKSIKEALCTKTPMLGMPLYAEQNYNAQLLLKLEIGIVLNKFDISVDQLIFCMKELLNNPAYSLQINKTQQMFVDRPIPALNETGFFLQRVMKKTKIGKFNNPEGTQQLSIILKIKAIEMNFLNYFLIDHVFVVLLMLLIIH